MATVVDRWDTLQSNGGRRLGHLASANDGGGTLVGGSALAHSEDHRDECTLVVDRVTAQRCALRECLRITETGINTVPVVTEWIVRRIVVSATSETATIVADPAWMLLATARAIRVPGIVGHTTRLAVTGTPEAILDEYLLTYAADDGYAWLSLGTIEPTDEVSIDVDVTSPLGLIHAVVAAIPDGAVWQIVRDGDDGYLLHLYRTLPANVVRAAVGEDLTALVLEQDVKDTMTIAQPLGRSTDAGRVTIAEAAWSIVGVTPTTIRVADPGTGVSPFVALNQGASWYVRRGLETWGIVLSTAIDGTMTLDGGTAGLAIGDVVTFDRDVYGRPVIELEDFAARMLYGDIVRTLRGEWRGERTLLKNPRLTGVASPWANVNGTTAIVMRREDFGVTLTGAASAARAAATSTATPLATDGWPLVDGEPMRFYPMDTLVVDPVNLDVTADAIPSTGGVLTLTVAGPGLPAALANGAVLTLNRIETRTWEVDGNQDTSGGTKTLHFKDAQTDGLSAGTTGLTFSGLGWTITPTVSYRTSGAHAGTVSAFWNSGMQTVTAPTSWTDGQSVTVTRVRETRQVLVSGAHSAGATSITLQAISGVGTRNFQTGDALDLSRTLSGELVITSVVDHGDGTLSATFNAAASSLDDVSAFDRDGLATMRITGDFDVFDGGSPAFITEASFVLTSITGSVALLTWIDGYTYDASANVGAQLATSNWTVPDYHVLPSGASWGSNGRATVPITVASGRQIPRGTRVAGTDIFVHTTATGPVSSVELAGWDPFDATWNGVTAAPTTPWGVWRVFADSSTLTTAGDTLTLAAAATADGSGAAALTLAAANTNAILDNAAMRLVRPALVPVTSPQTGSMIRLTSEVGGSGEPTLSTAGVTSENFPVRVDTNSTREVSAWAQFAIKGPVTLTPANGPVVSIIANGVVVASTPLEQTTTFDLPVTILKQHATTVLKTTAQVAVRAFGGIAADPTHWIALDSANAYVGTDEILPITDSPPANFGWHAANAELVARARPLQSVQLVRRAGARRAWESPVAVGTRMKIDGNAALTALDLRVVSTVRDLVDGHNTSVVLSTDTQRLTQKLVTR